LPTSTFETRKDFSLVMDRKLPLHFQEICSGRGMRRAVGHSSWAMIVNGIAVMGAAQKPAFEAASIKLSTITPGVTVLYYA
jgi:hypothetical protein